MPPMRYLAFAATVLVVGATAPAHAAIVANALSGDASVSNALSGNAFASNSLSFNSLTCNALATTGSAITGLNGVTVDAITLPLAPHR